MVIVAAEKDMAGVGRTERTEYEVEERTGSHAKLTEFQG